MIAHPEAIPPTGWAAVLASRRGSCTFFSLWESSESAEPHLEDGTAYRPPRLTNLDKIENHHVGVPAGAVAAGTGGAPW